MEHVIIAAERNWPTATLADDPTGIFDWEEFDVTPDEFYRAELDILSDYAVDVEVW